MSQMKSIDNTGSSMIQRCIESIISPCQPIQTLIQASIETVISCRLYYLYNIYSIEAGNYFSSLSSLVPVFTQELSDLLKRFNTRTSAQSFSWKLKALTIFGLNGGIISRFSILSQSTAEKNGWPLIAPLGQPGIPMRSSVFLLNSCIKKTIT